MLPLVLDEIAMKGNVVNKNHIAGAPVCSSIMFYLLMMYSLTFHSEQKLVLIALLTGKILPTSKTLGEAISEGLLHSCDPVLLDTEDILQH